MDHNHPLAGKDLTFEIEVVSVQGEEPVQMANWNTKMKKAELLEIARSSGLSVNTRSTKKRNSCCTTSVRLDFSFRLCYVVGGPHEQERSEEDIT